MADLQLMQDFVKQKMAQGASPQEIAEAFKAHGEDPAMIEQAVRINVPTGNVNLWVDPTGMADQRLTIPMPDQNMRDYYRGFPDAQRAKETLSIGNAKLYPGEPEGTLRGTNLKTMVGEGVRYALPAAVAFALPEAMLMQLPLLSRMGLSIGANALGTGMGDVAAGLIEGESKETILKKASLDMLMSATMNTAGSVWRVGTQGAMQGGRKTGIELMAQDAQDVLQQGDLSLTPGGMAGVTTPRMRRAESFARGTSSGENIFAEGDALRMDQAQAMFDKMATDIGSVTDDVRFGETMAGMLMPLRKNAGGPAPPTTGMPAEAVRVRGQINQYIMDAKDALYGDWRTRMQARFMQGDRPAQVELGGFLRELEPFRTAPEFEKVFKVVDKYAPQLKPRSPFVDVPEGAAQRGAAGFREVLGEANGVAGYQAPNRGSKVVGSLPDARNQPVMVDVEDAVQLKRLINDAIDDVPGKKTAELNALMHQSRELKRPIDDALRSSGYEDEANQLLLANKFAETSSDLLGSALIKSLMGKMVQSPTAVMGYLKGGNIYQKLTDLEELWNFARTGMKGAVKPLENMATFEEGVLKPFRYSVLNEAYDNVAHGFDPTKVLTNLKNKFQPYTLEKAFGPNYDEAVLKYVRAASYMQTLKFPEKMLPILMESGLLGTTAFQAAAANPQAAGRSIKTLGAMYVFSYAVAKSFNNPKVANRILTHMAEGPQSSKFTSAVYDMTSIVVREMASSRSEKERAFYRSGGMRFGEAQPQMTNAEQQWSGAMAVGGP